MHIPQLAPAHSRPVIEISPNAILAMTALAGTIFLPLFGSHGALIFLATGGILLLRQPGLIVPEVIKFWWIFAVPAFCLLTTLWSNHPSQTFRFSLQLGATFAIAVAIGNRVSAKDLFRSIYFLYLLAIVVSLIKLGVRHDGVWLGFFVSKNAFAAAISTFTLLAVALIFARDKQRMIIRLAALGAAALGMVLLVKAQSMGTLALTLLACAFAPFLSVFSRMPVGLRGATILFVILSFLLVGTFVFVFQSELFSYTLQTTGKDPTLTGRTELWQIAFRLIAEAPFGTGYGAFWISNNPNAEYIWNIFGVRSRSGFNFHNTFISNAVEIGWFGVLLQTIPFFAALVFSVRRALIHANASALFAAIFMVELVAQSFIEVVVFSQFGIRTILVIVFAIHGVAEIYKGAARPT